MMTQKNHKKALAAEQKSLIFLAALIALLLLIFSLCSEWFFVPGNLFNIVRQIADIGMIASVYKGIHIKTTKNGCKVKMQLVLVSIFFENVSNNKKH